jgi:DNA-binding CsgD family transcriptional regulator
VQRVVRFDAGWMALLLPGQDGHVALARSGYDDRVCGHLDSPAMLVDAELVGLSRSRRPIRGRDLPFPSSEVAGWAEYVEPAGFRDGVSAGLFTPEGRYLGLFALHTRATDQVSDAARNLLELLATSIASAVDPLRSLATIAGLVHQAAGGTALTPSGATLPVPGLPGHRLLAPGSDVLAAATAQLAEGGPHASFLAPLPEPVGSETHARITVVAAPPDLQVFATAVVLVSPAGDLHGLSHRELQVLGRLVTGASNEQIAAALGIATRTVEVHLDHGRAKLAASSRTAAAARALRLGLFVPPPPHVGRGAPSSNAASRGRPPPRAAGARGW